MSKRCCAASCFNAVATNRSVEYFGFPKSNEYAAAWAKAAGREDLLDKSLSNIIKYFLCSEHFSDDCFQDPPHNRKLKKTSRPVVVPIPTIFHNNFNECVSKALKEERTSMSVIEVGNIVGISEQMSIPETVFVDDSLNESEEVQSLEPIVIEAVGDVVISNEQQTSDYAEPTDIEVIEQYADLKVEEEEHNLPFIEDTATPEQLMHSQQEYDDGDTFERTTYTELIVGPNSCRLCLSIKGNELFVPIFDYGSEVAYILDTLLPGAVKPDDGLPQQICLACLESATRCLSTIEKFKAIQDKLKELQ
ncbi:THAP domain-containing protein 1 B isoform X2 [Aedes albopictus]